MLKLVNISKIQGKEYLLKDINLTLKRGRILGVISLNPLETTTLLKIINGSKAPSSGYIKINKKVFSGNLSKGMPRKIVASSFNTEDIFPNLSLIDNVFLGNMEKVSALGLFRKNKAIELARPLFHEFELPIAWYEKTEMLSQEEKSSLSVVRLFLFDSDYFLMDRIASNLTISCYEKFKEKCLNLKQEKKSIIFASDNVNQLFDICDEILVLRNGEAVFYSDTDQTNVDEVYNVMNNTQYTINQAITNKYNEFQKNIRDIEELTEKTLTIIENFCNIKNIFCCYLDEDQKVKTGFSKKFIENRKEVILQHNESVFNSLKKHRSMYVKMIIKEAEYYIFKIEYKNVLYAIVGFISKIDKNMVTLLKIISDFSSSFYYITNEIQKTKEEKRREHEIVEIKKEMDIAKKIQLALIPAQTQSKIYDISAKMMPAEDVGGDYYDFVEVTENRIWLGIGDVSGHGLTSGLIMMMAQTAFNTILLSNPNVSSNELIVQVNRVLYNNIRKRMGENHFMTLSFLLADEKGNVCYSGAHLDILIYRKKTKKIERIQTTGIWLGILPEISDKIKENKFKLDKGDVMLLYTDGIVEAMDAQDKQYGVEKLEEMLLEFGKKEIKEIRDGIIDNVLEYASSLTDDITLVTVKKI